MASRRGYLDVIKAQDADSVKKHINFFEKLPKLATACSELKYIGEINTD